MVLRFAKSSSLFTQDCARLVSAARWEAVAPASVAIVAGFLVLTGLLDSCGLSVSRGHRTLAVTCLRYSNPAGNSPTGNKRGSRDARSGILVDRRSPFRSSPGGDKPRLRGFDLPIACLRFA
jgi:hypothetical protein